MKPRSAGDLHVDGTYKRKRVVVFCCFSDGDLAVYQGLLREAR